MSPQSWFVQAQPATAERRRRDRFFMILAGFVGLATLSVVGTTFAANIGLNGGNDIEFGQGSQQTVTCDNAITVSPHAGFDAAAGQWGLLINLSDIDASACFGKTFVVTSWTAAGVSNDVWTFTLDNGDSAWGDGWMVTPGNSAWYYSSNGSSYTVSVVSTLDPQDLGTITVETSG